MPVSWKVDVRFLCVGVERYGNLDMVHGRRVRSGTLIFLKIEREHWRIKACHIWKFMLCYLISQGLIPRSLLRDQTLRKNRKWYNSKKGKGRLWMSEYKHKSHNVSVLMYHFVCPAKYRRVVIDEEVDRVIKETCKEISKRYEIDFLEIGTDRDHVHFLV